jgi:hypothetical protein
LSSAPEVNEAVFIKYNDSFYKTVVKKVLHITVPPSYVYHGVHESCGKYAGLCLGHLARFHYCKTLTRHVIPFTANRIQMYFKTRRVTRCLQHLQNASYVRHPNGRPLGDDVVDFVFKALSQSSRLWGTWVTNFVDKLCLSSRL